MISGFSFSTIYFFSFLGDTETFSHDMPMLLRLSFSVENALSDVFASSEQKKKQQKKRLIKEPKRKRMVDILNLRGFGNSISRFLENNIMYPKKNRTRNYFHFQLFSRDRQKKSLCFQFIKKRRPETFGNESQFFNLLSQK